MPVGRLKGGYRALDMGFPHEAMVDMTGGVTEVLKVVSLPRDLPAVLRHLLAKGALINCANCQVITGRGATTGRVWTWSSSWLWWLMFDLNEGVFFLLFFLFTLQGPLEQRNELGIMFRHAYSLTAVERVRLIWHKLESIYILMPPVLGVTEWCYKAKNDSKASYLVCISET